MTLIRVILGLMAFDSLLLGLWALTRPGDLFALLQVTPPRDALLWRLTGALTLAHVPCLLLAIARPARNAGLVLPPLLGRALLAAAWLWLLGTGVGVERPLIYLGLHDAVVVAVAGGGLAFAGRIPRLRQAAPAIME